MTADRGPRINLEELRRRINQGREIVVDQEGVPHSPEDEAVASQPSNEKTTLKPSRWF